MWGHRGLIVTARVRPPPTLALTLPVSASAFPLTGARLALPTTRIHPCPTIFLSRLLRPYFSPRLVVSPSPDDNVIIVIGGIIRDLSHVAGIVHDRLDNISVVFCINCHNINFVSQNALASFLPCM